MSVVAGKCVDLGTPSISYIFVCIRVYVLHLCVAACVSEPFPKTATRTRDRDCIITQRESRRNSIVSVT